jgi:serine/threonine-protein kinase
VLADRYRIVVPLGKGGMGEVYRADDLRLGQAVALKFLPPHLADHPDRLARLRQEVAAARRVSHRNVCRVYDLVEQPGLAFLTMEYIDGEDLAALLRKVDHLPEERAGATIACELCAALAAVHEQGLVHRDLKPANVMIDGRGKVRLTDFGLAAAAEDLRGADVRAGTPDYQAPEQLRGESVEVRSDLFALGLVLYELFTGERPFPADTRQALLKLYASPFSPVKPAVLVPELTKATEQAILRCLERDPKDRPRSANEVREELPGGDRLKAAREKGETPSPEEVANAGGEGGLSPAAAGLCLAAILAGVLACTLLLQPAKLIARVPLDLPPDVLCYEAGNVLKEAGYGPLRHGTYGFGHDSSYLRWVADNDESGARWDILREVRPAALFFWYRQSPSPLVPNVYYPYPGAIETGRITWHDPPPIRTGMAAVRLDLAGRLIEFHVVPPDKGGLLDLLVFGASTVGLQGSAQGQGPLLAASALIPGSVGLVEPDWDSLFKAAGLKRADFASRAARSRIPLIKADRWEAWTGTLTVPGRSAVPLDVEAAACWGRPVFFRVRAGYPAGDEADAPFSVGTEERHTGAAVVFVLLLAAAAVLAPWNLRRGRADRSGAFRLALFVFTLFMLVGLFKNRHVLGVEEVRLLVMQLACALYWAGLCWLSYVALEPFARRMWPKTLISWSRLLAGRVRDPRVGRDVLIGALAGTGWFALFALARLVPGWVGQPPPAPAWAWWVPDTFVSGYWAANVLDTFPYAVRNGLFFWLLFLVLFRAVFRKPWLAVGLCVVALTILNGPLDGLPPVSYLFVACAQALGVWVLVRWGVLAVISMTAVAFFLEFPITWDLSAWYAREGLLTVGLILTLAGYGAWTAVGGRRLVGKLLIR